MALQITRHKGVSMIEDNLIGRNADILDRHIGQFINTGNEVILNLEFVGQMDETAIFPLERMHRKAIRANTGLYIVGLQNANVLEVLVKTITSNILCHDRV